MKTRRLILFVLMTSFSVAVNAQQAVDLGLSVRWADRNMGATSSTEPGWFLAWGELSPKQQYGLENYRYNMGDNKTMTKYVFPSRETLSEPDNLSTLEPEDDVATATLGEGWRMPTLAEFTELKEQCTWQWDDDATHPGYRVTGPNGQHIFLPAAGMYSDEDLMLSNLEGYYWTSEVVTYMSDYAYAMRFSSRMIGHYVHCKDPRIAGFQVRAVSSATDGIEAIGSHTSRISGSRGCITVSGAEDEVVYVFDVMGRLVYHSTSVTSNETIPVPKAGVYLVCVGNQHVEKVVVIR